MLSGGAIGTGNKVNEPINYIVQGYWVKINSSPPSAAYMCRWSGSALVQIIACHLFDATPLREPMLTYCQLDAWEQTLVKFESKYKAFH